MRVICNLLTLLQLLAHSQGGHVQQAKRYIRAELRDVLGPAQHLEQRHYHGYHYHRGQRVHRLHMPQTQQRWSGRWRSMSHSQPFSHWTQWTPCGADCVKRRERYCRAKRKCGHTKHVEERKCKHCHKPVQWHESPPWTHSSHSQTPAIVINAAAAASSGPTPSVHMAHTVAPPHSVYQPADSAELVKPHAPYQPADSVELVPQPPEGADIDDGLEQDDSSYDTGEQGDFFVLKQRRRIKKQHQPKRRHKTKHKPARHYEDQNIDDESFEDFVERPRQALRPRDLLSADSSSLEGDVFQYEDFDFEPDNMYIDSEEYTDYRNGSWVQSVKERNTPDGLVPRQRRIYSKWSRWTKCSPKCTTRRYKKCRVSEQCGREVLREIAYCYTEGSFCQQWLQTQAQKTPAYEARPARGHETAMRRMHGDPAAGNALTSNAVVSDFIMNGKGYRGAEYAAPKLRCGLAPVRSGRRSMYNMLKIIGGKAARKGEWPWQVAIFNRFKEAFCGGTLIAPNWVLTAAHCVRKVLYVRMGEHNLDYEDGTEVQLRVLKSYKHPNFDKRTVDSDVALLRLPKAVNATSWIGYSCLPRPFQPLPKNMECTVIGWGKRRNRDVAGTSVLHQAEVPIIPMDNCRNVYHDYTITKNMFCAGHRRGRIDTCAGDSGGPLLCRDTTKPNHPWTIFGITSFGDGCAKRNKFGIYAKVPNYVDWVWSVVNCNGNCKLHQRP